MLTSILLLIASICNVWLAYRNAREIKRLEGFINRVEGKKDD